MKKTHLITAATLLAVMALISWTVWWFFLATYGQRLAAGANVNPDIGPSLTYGAVERFGFPFAIGLRFADVRVSTPWGDGAATATARTVLLSARPWRPRDIQVDLPEGLSYAVEGAGGLRLTGAARLGAGAATPQPEPRISLNLVDVTAAPAGAAPLAASAGDFRWRNDPAAGQSLDVAFREIALAENALFGPQANAAQATFAWTGPLPLHGAPREIAAWRDAGGQVRIEAAHIAWGALDLTASGQLGLDAAYRLDGSLDLGVRNGVAAVQRIQDIGLLAPQAATAAKALVALATLGNGGRAEAPLDLAEGEAKLAGVKIGDLTPVCACP